MPNFSKTSPLGCVIAVFAFLFTLFSAIAIYYGWKGAYSEKQEIQQAAQTLCQTGVGLALVSALLWGIVIWKLRNRNTLTNKYRDGRGISI